LYLFFQIVQTLQLRIEDLSATETNEMGMGSRVISVIMVAAVGETEFQNLPQFLEEEKGLIDRGQTEGGKALAYPLINLRSAGMGAIPGQDFHHGQPLRGEAETPFLQSAEHAPESFVAFAFPIGHVDVSVEELRKIIIK